MKKLLLAALLSFAASSAQAQVTAGQVDPGHLALACPGGLSPCFVTNGFVAPLGYQQITSLSASTSLTVPSYASVAVITVEGAGVRYRDDGTAPTASVGAPLAVGQSLTYMGALSNLKFIQQTSGATINVLYYR